MGETWRRFQFIFRGSRKSFQDFRIPVGDQVPSRCQERELTRAAPLSDSGGLRVWSCGWLEAGQRKRAVQRAPPKSPLSPSPVSPASENLHFFTNLIFFSLLSFLSTGTILSKHIQLSPHWRKSFFDFLWPFALVPILVLSFHLKFLKEAANLLISPLAPSFCCCHSTDSVLACYL